MRMMKTRIKKVGKPRAKGSTLSFSGWGMTAVEDKQVITALKEKDISARQLVRALIRQYIHSYYPNVPEEYILEDSRKVLIDIVLSPSEKRQLCYGLETEDLKAKQLIRSLVRKWLSQGTPGAINFKGDVVGIKRVAK